ncbi:MAG: YihY/virulence factor BrkB family protein [Clostridiales Family XIII bacterium]|jgi:membrane protein|nr:YihY/virulence factor BrkB family protein [Clostridiales Family XIII bacterium]
MDPYYAGRSAEIAFYLLLSLVPTMILLAQILDVFKLSMNVLSNILDEYISADMLEGLRPLLEYKSSGAISVMLIILALWASSKAMFSMMRIANYAYLGNNKLGKNPIETFFRERIRAILTIIVVLVTLAFALNILVYGKVFESAATHYINGVLGGDFQLDAVWFTFRWGIAFVLYFFMVSSIYYLLPTKLYRYAHMYDKSDKRRSARKVIKSWLKNSHDTYKSILPGSLFAALGMLLATGLYSYYMTYISSPRFNILYGGLSSIVILLLWFYIISYVLIAGIQINSAADRIRNERILN